MNKELVDLEEWNEIISHPLFRKLKEKLRGRITQLNVSIEKELSVATFDSVIKVAILNANKKEVNDLLNSFDFKQAEYQEAKRSQ